MKKKVTLVHFVVHMNTKTSNPITNQRKQGNMSIMKSIIIIS